MPCVVHLDFETRSAADLTKVGGDEYAKHPTTDILCAGYAFDDEPVKLWHPGLPQPLDLLDHIADGGEVHAYNAPFEISIINYVADRRYGWPFLSHRNAVCVMAQSYAMGLPGKLEGCAAALGTEEQKDLAGGRLMLQMSKPRSISSTGEITWWDGEERFASLYKYCIQDVTVERMAEKRMLKLSAYERRVWNLDFEINRRGITVDVPAVKNAVKLVEREKVRLNAEMQSITNNAVATCTAVQQIKDFIELFGITGESLDKAAVAEHLATDLHPTARRVIELRSEAGKAATAKFAPMVERAGADSRVRGSYQYSGANTRRWAGRGIQLHNLQRQKTKFVIIDKIITDIAAGMGVEELSMYYGNPMNVLGECTRSFLIAAPGYELLGADFSAIEARVLAWLAGQENVLDVFRSGNDIYKVAAASIFGCQPHEVTDEQRQVGKVAILALGYGGGVGAFQTMAKGYGVTMSPAYGHLMRVAQPDQRIRAEKTWESNKHKAEISKEEFLASDLTKIFWREANPHIVNYWAELEDAAISAVLNPGNFYTPGDHLPSIKFRKIGSFLMCQLPGGGVIFYPYPEVRDVKTPWGAVKKGLTYKAEDGQSKQWLRFTTYGGSIAENITQAVSRDLLADAMLRLDEEGYSIVLHTHDEAVCEEIKGTRDLKDMIKVMTANPAWAKGLPIAASGFTSRRYRK